MNEYGTLSVCVSVSVCEKVSQSRGFVSQIAFNNAQQVHAAAPESRTYALAYSCKLSTLEDLNVWVYVPVHEPL